MPFTKEFKELRERIKREYLGKPVPTRYMKRYGKKYNQKDILPLSYAIAKSRGVKIDISKTVQGGEKWRKE